MQIKLVINPRTLKYIFKKLGEDRVTIIRDEENGYKYISFEIRNEMDVLHLIHAGQESGVELSLYGVTGKPEEKAVA